MIQRIPVSVLASSVALLGLISLLVSIPEADACTPPRCEGGALLQAGAAIPSNTEALVWRPRTAGGRQPDVGPSNVRVTDGDGNEVPVSLEKAGNLGPNVYLIKPQNSWKSDHDQYIFKGADFCDDGGTLGGENTYESQFSTLTDASTFTSLGTLQLGESKRGTMTTFGRGGMCESQLEAEHRTVDLQLSSGATAWKDNMVYRTEVKLPGDDQYDEWTQWSLKPDLASWDAAAGGSQDFDLPRTTTVNVPMTGAWLYRVCDEDRSGGLPEGRWQVRIEAYRPGTGDTWTSNVVEVPLSCGELPPPSDDTGVGSDVGDAAAQGDVHWSGNGGGSGCASSTGTPPAPSGAVILLAVGLLAVRQRR